jgi:hypothetical protein
MAATFTITGIVPKTRSAPGGLFTSVQQVTFTTKPSEITGVIDVPSQTFTPDEVDRLVSEQAKLLEAVKAL